MSALNAFSSQKAHIMKRSLILVGIILIVAAVLWRFVLSTPLTRRIPDGWLYESRFIGSVINPNPDNPSGYDNEETVTLYERAIRIVETGNPPGSVTLEDTYITRDVNTNAVTWLYPFRAAVDPLTGQHISEEWKSDYFLFPRNVQQTTYNYRATSYEGLPMAFVGEEVVNGLNTYRFQYNGAAEYTEGYTQASEPYTFEPNEEVRCGSDTLHLDAWVEPVTGEIVRFEEGCSDGDWVYNKDTGEKVYPLGIWEGSTAGEVVIRRANEVASQRNTLLLLTTYLPLGAVVLGVAALAVGISPKLRNKQQP
jgi:hypothetical protein